MKASIRSLVANLGLQGVSLLIAVILWLYAAGEESVEVTLKVPLQVSPPKGRMTVLHSSLRNISLRLSVPRNILSMVSRTSVRAHHAVKGVEKAGQYNFRIESQNITLPPGNIRIVHIYPEVVTVTLDELIVQKLPIRVRLSGEPATGYVVDKEKIWVNPNAAMIEGPKGKLSVMQEIFTEPVDVIGRIRSLRRKSGLALDPDLRSITKGLEVDVFVPIHMEYGVSVFHDVSVKVLGGAKKLSSVSVQPEKVSFALSGPRAILDKMTSQDLLVYVDVSSLEKGEYEFPLQFKLPSEIHLNHDPPIVKVKIG